MIFDICLYKFCSGELSQYPALEYAKNIIKESRKLTFSLHGKRQLTLVKRGNSGKFLLYSIYNYVYNDKNDSIGICIVFHDKYPHDVDFLFQFCGFIIAEIIEEGKAFHFDSKGNIISDNNDLEFHHSTLSKHKDKIKATLQNVKTKVRAIPRNVYNNFEDQHVICQLSDKSWSLDEIFKTNNVIIITEEIEEENINSMRSFIKKSNETVDDLNKKIKKLEEQLKKAEKEKKQSQTNPPKKQSNNTNGTGMDTTVWITLGVIGAIILLNVIAPWFVSTMPIWLKFALLAAAGFGMYAVGYALEENHNGKYVEALGWSGAVAILLSTIITIYGICGGFSPKIIEGVEKTQTISNDRNVIKDDKKDLLDEKSSVARSETMKNNKKEMQRQDELTSSKFDTLKEKSNTSTLKMQKKEAPIIDNILHQESIVKPMTKDERFKKALKTKDWGSLRKLADEGYSPAYLPLARHYMNNSRQHGLAKKYAEKAKRAGIAGATEILNELEDLDF